MGHNYVFEEYDSDRWYKNVRGLGRVWQGEALLITALYAKMHEGHLCVCEARTTARQAAEAHLNANLREYNRRILTGESWVVHEGGWMTLV